MTGAICGTFLVLLAGKRDVSVLSASIRTRFLSYCDLAVIQLNLPGRVRPSNKRPVPFYIDSYVVRALCTAYDMTHKEVYLDACKMWSDRMMAFQKGMRPGGFYYMNYGRRPFDTTGSCYDADNGCIAMGVLATAVHCKDEKQKQRYMASAKSFARLVAERYIDSSGGICNGLWPTFDGPWWCSSGTVGALFFHLYEATGDRSYLDYALRNLAWLNNQDLDTVGPLPLKDQGPSLPMYTFEAYSAGWPYVKGTRLEPGARAQVAWFSKWASAYRFSGDGQWESKHGGLPFHLMVLGHDLESPSMLTLADRQLDNIDSLLQADHRGVLSQFAAFSMLSMAERLAPGAAFARTSPLKK
jgi:hypothetical protein